MVIGLAKLNKWKNTDIVIERFKKSENKGETSFIMFDIESFYPSVSLDLINKNIDFAKSIHNLSNNDLKIIMSARKTLLFHHEEPWMKKNREEDFEVPMECHDGAEICEFFGRFILSKISPILQEQNNIGLYKDDSLDIFRNLKERKKRSLQYLIVFWGLSIAVTTKG